MAVLKNAKHERFAQALAAGRGVGEAYVEAGYPANRGNATKLKQRESVGKRVDELLAAREAAERKSTERAIEQTAITKAGVIQMLLDDREQAKGLGMPSAATQAAKLIGQELGMFVERKQIALRRVADMTVEEIDALLADLDGPAASEAAQRTSH